MRQKTIGTASAITAEMLTIKNPVAGTLTETKRPSKNGTTRPHFHLQQWVDGKNKTTYIPADKAESVREGIARHKRLAELMNELAGAGIAGILRDSDEDPVKKNG
jgi:hypothetical protein